MKKIVCDICDIEKPDKMDAFYGIKIDIPGAEKHYFVEYDDVCEECREELIDRIKKTIVVIKVAGI